MFILEKASITLPIGLFILEEASITGRLTIVQEGRQIDRKKDEQADSETGKQVNRN